MMKLLKFWRFCLLSAPFFLLSLAPPVAWASTIDAYCRPPDVTMGSTVACPDGARLTTPNTLVAPIGGHKTIIVTEYCYPPSPTAISGVSRIIGDALSRSDPGCINCQDGGVKNYSDHHSQRTYTCYCGCYLGKNTVSVRSITCQIQAVPGSR